MGGRVLIIDDEEKVRKDIRLHLTKAGFDVIEAEDGEKGIQKAKDGDNPLMLSAIICDIRMPKVSGVDAIDHFRRELPSTPIIVLTVLPDVHLAVELMKKGVVDYLVKPVPEELIVTTVQKAVQERSWGQKGKKAMYP